MTRQDELLARIQREADRAIANPKVLTGVIVAATGALLAGECQVRLADKAVVVAVSLSDRGYPAGTKVRVTNQGGKYYAAGPVRRDR